MRKNGLYLFTKFFSKKVSFEVIVVDNNSVDKTVEKLKISNKIIKIKSLSLAKR